MSAFNEAYRAMVAKQAKCPKCPYEANSDGEFPVVEIDPTGTKGRCDRCGFSRPIEAFLPREQA